MDFTVNLLFPNCYMFKEEKSILHSLDGSLPKHVVVLLNVVGYDSSEWRG